jgi:gamma-glutamyltranspeptidase/glutathione hydrolase
VFEDGVTVPYRDARATFAPQVGGGLTVAEALRILDGFDLAAAGFGTARSLHLVLEAQRRAFLDRFRHLGDPAFVDVPYRGLLSPDYAAVRRASIDPSRATPELAPGDPWRFQGSDAPAHLPLTMVAPADVGHTTHVSVVDRERNAVALTSTLGATFGSAVVVPGTGILLNNGTTWFDPRPDTPNSIAPGRRILWAGSPAIVTRGDRLVAAVGAPGGRKVISAVLQVILNLIDFGMGMQDAVSAPRGHSEGGESIVDSRFGPEVIGELRAMGHAITAPTETFATSFFGRPNGVLVDPSTGRLRGGVNQYKPYVAVGL